MTDELVSYADAMYNAMTCLNGAHQIVFEDREQLLTSDFLLADSLASIAQGWALYAQAKKLFPL